MAATKRNTRSVGRETEQRVASYLRERGYAGAERMVRTGYRARGRASADHGDLTGTPGICWQVKSLQPATEAERMVRTWLEETEQQRVAGGAVLGILVVRRWKVADTGRWWGFVDAGTLLGLADGTLGDAHRGPLDVPVRLELGDLITMLDAWGWGPGDAPLQLVLER